MTPGQRAVAALYDRGDGVVLVAIGDDGEVFVKTGLSDRDARAAINLTVERAIEDIEGGTHDSSPRKIRGGVWAVRLRCPDGRSRMFVERRKKARLGGRIPLSPVTRWGVLMRDGFRCRYCGATAPEVQLEVDHIVPVAEGGTNDPANLAAACDQCNGGKGRNRLAESPRVTDRVTAEGGRS